MFAKSRHLFVAAGAAILLGVALWRGMGNGAPRVLFGLVLLLFLPGYAWVEALFPPGAVRRAERLALILGLSMALAIVGGLLLKATPWGLQTRSWALLATGVVLLGVLVALVRHTRDVAMPVLVTSSQRVRPPEALLFGLALMLAVSAGVVGLRAARQLEATDFTQLWLLRRSPSSVEVGVGNLEGSAVAYRLDVRLGEDLIEQQSPLLLGPGEQQQTVITLPAGNQATTVQALLFRLDDPAAEPYRRTELWLSSAAGQ